ncbi:unnamed protein product [Malus baccata var. baccata]
MRANHREAYVDSSTPLVKGQLSKSRFKLFYNNWSYFLCRNVLGSSNNGNPTLESAKVLFGMLTSCDVPLFLSHFCDNCPRTTKDLDKNLMGLSNVMIPPPNVSQEKKISYLDSSTHNLKGKHIRFTYSFNENEDKEGLGHGLCPGDVLVENVIAAGSPVGSDDSSQLKEF